jgi:acylphosphatase
MLRYLISGRVQGVGFRNFALRRASALGVIGWVRNLPDGRVEVVASGGPEAMSDLEKFLTTGPHHARVESVEISEVSDEQTQAKTFEIKT